MTQRSDRQGGYGPDRQNLMKRIALCLFCAAIACAAPLVQAQEVADPDMTLTASGEEYLSSLRFRRIETDVAYVDPTAPPPALDTRERPRSQTKRDGDGVHMPNGPVTLISALVLVGIGYLVLRFGGASALSFSSGPKNIRRGPQAPRSAAEETELPASLAQIQEIADRRHGVVLLARKALARATELNGVLMQRSWTAREALRHIPADQPHGEALRALVMTSEGVLFGEHEITEEAFQTHLHAMLPLLRTRPA